MTARFCVYIEMADVEPAVAMLIVLTRLSETPRPGDPPFPIRVTGLQYGPDISPPCATLIGPGVMAPGGVVSGPSPLDEQNRLMAEFLEVAKKQLKQQKGDDDWKGEDT